MNGMTSKDELGTSGGDSDTSPRPLGLVAVFFDSDTLEVLKIFVESVPSMARLRASLPDYQTAEHDSITDLIGEPGPDVCLIDFDKDRREAIAAAERIHSKAPETAIFAVSARSEADLIIQAMRCGCSEFLVKPIDRTLLLHAVARVGGRRKEKKAYLNALVMAFMGAKGGCGVTTIVTHLAALLASSYSRKTLVVDLHPVLGDASLYLGLTRFRYDAFELMENTDRLDAELLQGFIVHHASGLDLIPGPQRAEPARQLFPGAVNRTFEFLRHRYEFILVDLRPELTDLNLELIRGCDQLYLVTVAEVAPLRNAAHQIESLMRLEVPEERIRVILNRSQKRSVISDAQIEKVIRRKIFWRVPNQYHEVVRSISGGNPAAELASSEVLRNLMGWAGALGIKTSAEEKKEGRGIFGFRGR
jgi:pilus assembly protein CpaE